MNYGIGEWVPTGNYQYGVNPYTKQEEDPSIRFYEFVNYVTHEYRYVKCKLV